eukprot:gnl/TRDRNA2_/TRDRNA2_158652_c3_seq1.p1 gnl/TRDRNA2_/TRDRNA2_158652_c3~~gnl/TRDRNA2_/TRDRNA2_158652_c3_seq1.p1  ORF type:complete len:136 (-),score=7.71 gnl/TRDRNA2_/TRDRNA2_158652_c3_seq1:127-534(-)
MPRRSLQAALQALSSLLGRVRNASSSAAAVRFKILQRTEPAKSLSTSFNVIVSGADEIAADDLYEYFQKCDTIDRIDLSDDVPGGSGSGKVIAISYLASTIYLRIFSRLILATIQGLQEFTACKHSDVPRIQDVM